MTTPTQFTHVKRRKAKDDGLPITAADGKRKLLKKGKRVRQKRLYRRLTLGAIVLLVVGVIATVIQQKNSEGEHESWRKLASLVTTKRDNVKYSDQNSENGEDEENRGRSDDGNINPEPVVFEGSDTDEGGCHGASIHEIAHQEPNPPSICINDSNLMPTNWRPPHDVEFQDDGSPWTEEEELLAQEAAEKGLDELIDFYENVDEDRIRSLGIAAIDSIFDYVIGSGNSPMFHSKALKSAIHVLFVSSKYFAGEEAPETATECDVMFQKFKLTGYSHRLQQEDPDDEDLKELRNSLVENLNLSIHACGDDLNEIMDKDESWQDALKNKDRDEEDVYNWVLWSIAITECLIVHDLRLPEEAPDFVANVWRYFEDYKLPDYEDGLEDDRGTWVQMAYLATHLQFVATGYGRHYSYVKDAPFLYHFYRDNFYSAFDMGGHDLVAEMIHALGSYGCSVHNDIQLRHGVRYMLHLYKKAGHSFIKLRERWEARITNDYNRIHNPWTGIASVMTQGCFEPEIPGSYGHAFRQTLKVVPVEQE